MATSTPKCPSRKLTSQFEVTQPEWSLAGRLSNQVGVARRFNMQTISPPRGSNDGGFRRLLVTVKIEIMMVIGPVLRLAHDPQQWNAINYWCKSFASYHGGFHTEDSCQNKRSLWHCDLQPFPDRHLFVSLSFFLRSFSSS